MLRTRFFGQYLFSNGVITAPQLAAATEYQKKYNTRLGDYAVALGFLSKENAKKINTLQLSEDLLFGEAALRMGLLQKKMLNELIEMQRVDHVMLGEALVDLGYVEQETIDKMLESYFEEHNNHMKDLVPIPMDIPLSDLARKLFQIVHQLLFRAWGLQNKPGELVMYTKELLLSDWNAIVKIWGDYDISIVFAAPHDIAQRAVFDVAGEKKPTNSDMNNMVLEFTDLICKNLSVALNQNAKNIERSTPRQVDFRLPIEEDKKGILIPYLTHEGQVFAGFIC